MRAPGRMNLAAVMGFVGLVAVATAAVRAGSGLWFLVILAVTLGTLGFASILAVAERGRWGAVGFAVFGWIWLLMTHSEMVGGPIAATVGTVANQAADAVARFTNPQVQGPVISITGTIQGTSTSSFSTVVDSFDLSLGQPGGTGGTIPQMFAVSSSRFWTHRPEIIRLMLTLGFAAAGGVVGLVFARRMRRRDEVAAPDGGPPSV